MAYMASTNQIQPWPSIVCPHCGLSVKLPEGPEAPIPEAVLITPRLSHDIARWEYQCADCRSHTTVYVELEGRVSGAKINQYGTIEGQ